MEKKKGKKSNKRPEEQSLKELGQRDWSKVTPEDAALELFLVKKKQIERERRLKKD